MSDAPKPSQTPEAALRRRVTTSSFDQIAAGLKACAMLKQLAVVARKAAADGHALTATGLVDWLKANDFDVEGL